MHLFAVSNRVCTEPKSQESSGIYCGTFKVLKSLENYHRYGKVWKKSLKTVMLTWKMKLFITLVITPAFVNFLAFHET